MEELDRQDVVLLNELQRDSHQTVQQLAERVGLSSTPCWKRIKEKVGLALCVIAELNLTRHNQEVVAQFEQEVADCPQIVGCYATTGQADYVIKVLMPDIKAYERFLHETVFKLAGVTHVRSSVVLKEVKAEMRLPIEPPGKVPRAKARRA